VPPTGVLDNEGSGWNVLQCEHLHPNRLDRFGRKLVHKYASEEAPGTLAVQGPAKAPLMLSAGARQGGAGHLPADRRAAICAHVCVQPVLQALLHMQNNGQASGQEAERTAV
jgi:hypothetical protein